MLLFTYVILSGTACPVGSNSEQTATKSTQTQTKTTQTQTKSTQAKTKSGQTVTKSAQTKTKSSQTGTKSTSTKTKSTAVKAKAGPKSPVSDAVKKIKDPLVVSIGTQNWAIANLDVVTFLNGDTIQEARTNKDWVAAGESGKPAWCYYNNDPKMGPKYGKLYNWFAVNDPRGLAPSGWTLASDADWAHLANYLGGQGAPGYKMKSTIGWSEGNNGSNETGFTGLAGGYRVENGTFVNIGSIGIWWSSTESKSLEALDHYLSQTNSLGRSSSPKQRGESVRCLRK